jgi:cell division transport system permease protein
MAYILLISSLVFSILSIVLMINTLQLQLISDKSEILTMQVVGAKPSFIKRPYLHRAIRISIRATVIAAAGMLLLLLYVQFYLLADTAIINWLLYALVVFVMLVVSNFLLLAVTNNRLNAYLK